MKIIITNKSSYKHAYLISEGKSYNLSDNQIVEVDDNQKNIARLFIDIRDKDIVYPDFIDLFFGILNPDNSICKIKCSYVCDIVSSFECCNIVINDLISGNDNNITYESVFMDSQNADIHTVDYKLNDIESTKKRHTLLQLFVLSSLPLTLLLIFLCIVNFSWELILIVLLDILLLVIPALRRIKRFNKVCTDANARNILLDSELIQRNGVLLLDKKETKIDKFVYKILERIFK